MKMLSLTQPYASAIPLGLKTWETRSWPTKYRGPVGICASKSFPRWAKDFASSEWLAQRLPVPSALPLGCVVAVAEITDCVETKSALHIANPIYISALDRMYGDWTWGRYAWKLENIRPLPEPIPCKGALGLWAPGPELEAQILAQLAAL